MTKSLACTAPSLDQVCFPTHMQVHVSTFLLSSEELFAPFTNPSCGLLMAWNYSGTTQKFAAELNQLTELMCNPLFNNDDLSGFSHTHEVKDLDNYLDNKLSPFHEEHGCIFQDPIAQTFNMTPSEQYWKVSEEHNINEINALPHKPDDDLECAIASLMTCSDLPHLTNFSDASLWPFYIYFSNQSKYPHGKPMSMACHHVAYIPSAELFFLQISPQTQS
ncbi:hypothetical protein PAXRUDRAFT_33364 [Paxillus rubicundulus Ve08.2h10]|uniref:Unplaced genomic scaffold scaffold_265, whole genome shotgun sequence n=1 Tax=Paxillus rubicundulus Ve08.2h10 TaxID=930991 RepID=A0A0D0DXE9_9AGAM|nr:hypothetical protein PAXRUDRAFT_33364 [Paxillus rubicundulus Ve08.2h10]